MRTGEEGSTVKPDGSLILDSDGKGRIGTPAGRGNETREDRILRSWVARVVEVGLNDRVVLGEELEDDLLAHPGSDSVGGEDQSVSAYGDGLDCWSTGSCSGGSIGKRSIAWWVILGICEGKHCDSANECEGHHGYERVVIR